MATPPQEDSLAMLALNVERDVTAYLEKAFNLNDLGEVEDTGAGIAAFKVIAHLNAAVIRLSQFENTILNRAGTRSV
jgi:hypothetical protein